MVQFTPIQTLKGDGTNGALPQVSAISAPAPAAPALSIGSLAMGG